MYIYYISLISLNILFSIHIHIPPQHIILLQRAHFVKLFGKALLGAKPMDTHILFLIVGLGLSFFMAFNLGANDAATPLDTSVGANVISIKKALLLFSIFSAIGALSQGYMNIKTISGGLVPKIDVIGAISISLVASLWSFFCSWKGLEISNTYTVIGSFVGYALTAYGSFRYETLTNILLSWVISPIISIGLAYALYKLLLKGLRNNLRDARVLQALSHLLIGALCFSAYSFGVNDVGNATGVYVAVTQEMLGLPSFNTMLFLSGFGAVGIAIGGLTLGHRVVETVAYKIVRIDVLSGFIAETTNALVVYLFSTIPYIFLGYGLPISSSIVGVGSIIGTGLARGHGLIDKKTIVRLVITWLITIPATAVLSASLYSVLSSVIRL